MGRQPRLRTSGDQLQGGVLSREHKREMHLPVVYRDQRYGSVHTRPKVDGARIEGQAMTTQDQLRARVEEVLAPFAQMLQNRHYCQLRDAIHAALLDASRVPEGHVRTDAMEAVGVVGNDIVILECRTCGQQARVSRTDFDAGKFDKILGYGPESARSGARR